MPAYMGDFVRGLETVLDDLAVAEIKRKLDENAAMLGQREFQSMSVRDSAFGASAEGTALGGHHARAHQVISETLDGVLQDMRDFRTAVDRATRLLDEADATAGDTLSQRRAAVEQLEDANRWFAADAGYEQGRNNQEVDR